MKVIHVTERSSFKECRRRWKYEYLWQLKAPSVSVHLIFGTVMHHGLELLYRGEPELGKILAALPAKLKAELGDRAMTPAQNLGLETPQSVLDLAGTLLTNYVARYTEDLATTLPQRPAAFDHAGIVDVERTLSCRVPGRNAILQGKADLVIRRQGRLWIVDHKTVTSFVDSSTLWMDDQMTAYLWLVRRLFGEMPGGAIYNQIRKRDPAVPVLLKNGAMSRSNIDTTWGTYQDALVAAGLDPNDYLDMKVKLAATKYFDRTEITRTKAELDEFERHLRAETADMTSKLTVMYPNPSWMNCRGCEFLTLCKCESEGGDVQGLIDAMYPEAP